VLEELNPIYRRKYIPETGENCVLILPKDKIEDYLKYENKIISFILPKKDYISQLAHAGSTNCRKRIIHVVSRGEYFHKIALNYNCTIENLKAWNNIDGMTLYPGQILEIWVRNDHKF
jgi:membrane-bound lytic murein transglycosylase D